MLFRGVTRGWELCRLPGRQSQSGGKVGDKMNIIDQWFPECAPRIPPTSCQGIRGTTWETQS